MIYPWHYPHWESLLAAADQLPHALLLCGPEGGGKRAFAESLAQRLLCEDVGSDGQGCGSCPSCRWFESGNHPDLRRVVPESEAEEASAEEDEGAEAGAGRKKKASRQILIDQVRALVDFVMVGTHRNGMRVILIDPAEAMNMHTANALLKLLEEPTMSTVFLLVSHAPRRLLPTIRSRCRTLALGKPDTAAALAWLKMREAGADASALALAGGMPLAALALVEAGSYRRQFEATVGGLDSGDPLQAAAQWEGWLRQKEGEAPRLPLLVAWLQKWVFDLALWKLAGRTRFFPDAAKTIERLAGRAPMSELVACYNELSRMRRIAEHPLNPRLFLEDMAIRYARMLRGLADG